MPPPFSLGLLLAAGAALSPAFAAEEPAITTSERSSPPKIEQLSDNKFRLEGITFDKDTRRITFDAAVNQDQDTIEYAIVHVTGKDHESLLNTKISPYHLQVVLLLCGYKPDHGDLFTPTDPSQEQSPPAPRDVLVTVEWKSPEGSLESTRIEDWILDLSTGKAMSPSSWAYTGSAIIDGSFQAEVEGSILAIYLDELALVNYPGAGNHDDEIWLPNAKKMPPLNHPVRVSFEPSPPPTNESK